MVDWDSYKRLCDAPDTFPRWMLEQTIALAEAQGERVRELVAALEGEPLAKPRDHRGGAVTDMFRLELPLFAARRVHELVCAAVAAGLTTEATRARGLGGFEAAWREYLEHLQQG